ncbi:unnamed protein product, partial [Symbiodinium sp. CCMP2456]
AQLRKDNIDVDGTIDARYKAKNTQVKNYAVKNYDRDNQAAQKMQALEEEITPTKSLPVEDGSPVVEQVTPTSQEPSQSSREVPNKRRRLQRRESKKQLEQMIHEPHNILKHTGQDPPTSMTSIKTWVTNIKKTPAHKQMAMDQHMQQMHQILEEGKFNKGQLQGYHIKKVWNLPQTTEMRAVPELYTYSKFTHPCAVSGKFKFPKLNNAGYAEIDKEAAFCYIGSTNLTRSDRKREYKRVAQLRQLQQQKLPKTEIAIRYWNDTKSYEQFSTILFSQHSAYIDAWAEEHCLLQRWQPKLNYPFVTKELVKKAHGLVPKRQQPHAQRPPDSLATIFEKIRRRVQGQKRQLLNVIPKQAQFWKLLCYAISSDTKQEYDASRELRSGKHDMASTTMRQSPHPPPVEFLQGQLRHHQCQLEQEPRLTHRLVKHIISIIPDDYIIHNEDHANASPKHYPKLLSYDKPIPYGYIMMKRKESWSKGRTIIAYANTCVGKLLKIAALALQQMLNIAWPAHFGNVSTPELWSEIHLFLSNNEQHLSFLNHDLVGFFNSIPQADIMQSIQFLTSEFLDKNNLRHPPGRSAQQD